MPQALLPPELWSIVFGHATPTSTVLLNIDVLLRVSVSKQSKPCINEQLHIVKEALVRK
jgi:hypothetical protein